MRVSIRADSRMADGAGHVMRCLALAQELRRSSHEVTWLLDSPAHPWLLAALAEAGWPETDQSRPRGSAPEIWVERPDVVILDSYRVEAAWLARARAAGITSVVVVDDSTPPYAADLCVAPGLATTWRGTGAASTNLFGIDYLLIRDEVLNLRLSPPKPSGLGVPRVVCVLGGSDSGDYGLKLAAALGNSGASLAFDVVGEAQGRLHEWQESRSGVQVRIHPHNAGVIQLACRADLVISGAGVAAWELLYLGVPTALLQMADNQQANYREMTMRGWATGLGGPSDLNFAVQVIRDFATRWRPTDRHLPRHRRGPDGLGAQRVVRTIESLGSPAPAWN